MTGCRTSADAQPIEAYKPHNRRAVISWALYDWANSAFATTVMAGFFPVFFKQYWSTGVDATVSTFRLGTANSAASIIVAVLAPFLGAIADQGGTRKRLLGLFAVIGVANTAALFLIAEGAWDTAIVVFVAANIGFSGSMIFYDSLLVSVSDDTNSDRVSAFGYALGYLGGGVLFAINVWMTLQPERFGLADASSAVRVSFIMVAIWWAVFTLPVLLFVEETNVVRKSTRAAIRDGLKQLSLTFKALQQLRTVFLFLIAYFLYIDALQTVARMGVDYGLSLGFDAQNLITALLITQFVGFPAALVFGRIGQRFGAKRGIYLGLAVAIGACIFAFFMQTVPHFYILAISLGLVQGGIQSLSRSFYSRIIPKNKATEFFGFYNMLGKFSTVIGPILMGLVGVATNSPRFGVLSIVVLFAAGWIVLVKVNEARGHESAEAMEA